MRKVIPKGAVLIPSEAERVFKGIIYDVYHWPQKMFDGSIRTFEMLKRPDTAKAIAVKDGKIAVLEQDQPDLSTFYDIPGGRNDEETEDELEAAKRELLEETGLKFKTWKLLSVFQPFQKIEHFVYIFLATDFESQTEITPDVGEKIVVKWVTLDEMKAMVNDSKNRYLPKEILNKVSTLRELLDLPEYKN